VTRRGKKADYIVEKQVPVIISCVLQSVMYWSVSKDVRYNDVLSADKQVIYTGGGSGVDSFKQALSKLVQWNCVKQETPSAFHRPGITLLLFPHLVMSGLHTVHQATFAILVELIWLDTAI